MTSGQQGRAETPRSVVMDILNNAWLAQAISAVTGLDVPDLIQQHGPLTAAELVDEYGVEAQPELLQRVMRACAGADIFSEDADGRFGPTPLSLVLTLEAANSAKRFAELYGGPWWRTFGTLPDVLKNGLRPRAEAERSTADQSDETAIGRFGESMKGNLHFIPGLLEHCDLSAARELVDVGGGFGHMAMAILDHHPSLKATVVDLPEVAGIAERRAASERSDLRDRLTFVGRDMFDELPPADSYLLSRICHNLDDTTCIRLLRNCAANLTEGGRIICLDAVFPPMGDTTGGPAKLLDLLMMMGGGRERTEPQWRSIFNAAALSITSIVLLDEPTRRSIVQGTTGKHPD